MKWLMNGKCLLTVGVLGALLVFMPYVLRKPRIQSKLLKKSEVKFDNKKQSWVYSSLTKQSKLIAATKNSWACFYWTYNSVFYDAIKIQSFSLYGEVIDFLNKMPELFFLFEIKVTHVVYLQRNDIHTGSGDRIQEIGCCSRRLTH